MAPRSSQKGEEGDCREERPCRSPAPWVAGIPVETVLRATLPFLVPLLISLVAITAVPELSLWLPDLVFGPRP